MLTAQTSMVVLTAVAMEGILELACTVKVSMPMPMSIDLPESILDVCIIS